MLDTLCFAESSWMTLRTELESLADALKSGRERATIIDRKGFADSVGDQVVTVIGAAYCADMKGHEICTRVDQSNWSKFVDGKPVFFPNGKIAKSEGYRPPNLEGTY